MHNCIKPGQIWLDTSGKPIQAHGFSVFYQDGTYYWYGENKEKTVKDGNIWHWGVRCYTSVDLYNWENRGLIIPPDPDDFSSPLHPNRCMDRPHIIYCKRTGKYVAWLKIMCQGNSQSMCVMEADSFFGPYEFVHKLYKPLDMHTGDFDLYVDEETEQAYFIFDRPHFEIVVADLDERYTSVTGNYTVHCETDGTSCYGREAPTHFVRNGKHYLITSGTTWYYPNESRLDIFENMHGQYQNLGNPCVGQDAFISHGGQFTDVLHVPNSDLYIAMADRWIPDMETARQIGRGLPMAAKLRPKMEIDRSPKTTPELPAEEQIYRDETALSTYVWLPIRWNGDIPEIHWLDSWRIEDYL